MEPTTIEAACGPIQGREKEGALLFAGIPYAHPPVGELRFKAPRPLGKFATPYSALKFGPAAPQLSGTGLTDSASVRWDEDCLTLNISAPIAVADADDQGGRAVLVWIHGGGYATGQGAIPWYNGNRFAKNQDIVVVSINYRLGALGFADMSALGDEFATSSVNGTLDQIAALTWVRNNIAAFGGDPNRITIAGESAGGFSVATLLGCEVTKGLFQRAILQSGAAHHTLPKAAAERVTEAFLRHLGQDNAVGALAASADDILAAQKATMTEFASEVGIKNKLGTAVSPFYPAHGTALLPESPLQAIRRGVGAEVAIVTGSNTDETTLWSYGEVDEEKVAQTAASSGAEAALNEYRKNRPDATNAEILTAMTSDHMFRIPSIRLLEARASHTQDNWAYQFDWESRGFGGKLGATHSLEIPFMFDNLDRAGVDIFLGPGDLPQALATTMHQAWADFIKHGDPGWPRYELGMRTTQFFDETCHLVNDPAGSEREAWEGVR